MTSGLIVLTLELLMFNESGAGALTCCPYAGVISVLWRLLKRFAAPILTSPIENFLDFSRIAVRKARWDSPMVLKFSDENGISAVCLDWPKFRSAVVTIQHGVPPVGYLGF
jgi:hypothetical protein